METLVRLEVSKRKHKKYKALVRTGDGRTRVVHFGDSRYQQYRDRTPLRAFAHLDHGDRARMQRYYQRHSGVSTRKAGIAKEKRGGRLTARLLSHLWLW